MRAQVAEVGEAVDHLLAPFRRSSCGVPGRRRYSLVAARAGTSDHHSLYRDCSVQSRSLTWASLADGLLAALNRHAIDGFAEFAVHAGVVAAGDRVLAFPADSGAGKSTMTAACLAAGFDYVSDEALCVEFASSRVLPYPKPVTLSEHSCSLLGIPTPGVHLEGDHPEAGFRPEELGAATTEGDLELCDIVRLVRHDGPSRLRPLPASEAVGMLLRMSFNHYKRPRESFQLVTDLARHSRAWELQYDHPAPAAALLWDRLGAVTPQA
ncbi:MAG: hypothetical protein KY452_08735 [Actinobacteria bacterium]|nr:hypothetical protein [Actinomycetota bacterium]